MLSWRCTPPGSTRLICCTTDKAYHSAIHHRRRCQQKEPPKDKKEFTRRSSKNGHIDNVCKTSTTLTHPGRITQGGKNVGSCPSCLSISHALTRVLGGITYVLMRVRRLGFEGWAAALGVGHVRDRVRAKVRLCTVRGRAWSDGTVLIALWPESGAVKVLRTFSVAGEDRTVCAVAQFTHVGARGSTVQRQRQRARSKSIARGGNRLALDAVRASEAHQTGALSSEGRVASSDITKAKQQARI